MTDNGNDTIAAIATPPGMAAISIVRLSGPRAIEIADRVFRSAGAPVSQRPGGVFCHGVIRAPTTETSSASSPDLDEAILLVFRAPHSYTREDVIEFQGHGGRACAERILQTLLRAGARPAEPGEFTQRAFLSGRIDLLQAEAVMDLISAQSDRAAASAIEQLEGVLSSSITNIYDGIISICSDIEAALDFSEDDIPPVSKTAILGGLMRLSDAMAAILATWGEGRRLREGARVVLAGRPNVGKSTLLNALLGWSRAIVTDVPGTTRDTIEESFVLRGYPVRLVDTAGIRESDCVIERAGVSRARDMLARADVILYLLDAASPPSKEEVALIESLPVERLIVVWNKVDLREPETNAIVDGGLHVRCSASGGHGLPHVLDAIAERLGLMRDTTAHAAISERHRREILEAHEAVGEAHQELEAHGDLGLAPAATCLRRAAEALGRVVGRTYTPDLLDRIFSRFCIGK